MLNHSDISILLVTGYSPRRNALVDLLQDVCGKDTNIQSIADTSDLVNEIEVEPKLCLLDLANIKQPSLEVIKEVKDCFIKTKIIAVHIYSSSILVDPLFQAGIVGYLTYEPTRSSIRTALDCVLSNQNYIPEDILSS